MIGRGLITITLDDNDDTIYTEAFTRMQVLGLKGNHACITGTVGDAGLMTEAQIQEMYDAGWDIINHTNPHTNFTTISLAQVDTDVTTGYDELGTFGWTRARRVLIPPQNGITETILNTVLATGVVDMCTMDTVGGFDTANRYPFNRYRIRRRGVGNNAPEVIKDWIDDAILKNQYLHLNFHKISTDVSALDYPPDDFQEVIEHIAQRESEGQLQVFTMTELLAFLDAGNRGPATRRVLTRDSDGSLYFDGSGDVVAVTDSTTIKPSGTGSWTVSAWLNPASKVTQRVLTQGLTRMIRVDGVTKRWQILMNGLTPDRLTAGAVRPNRWQMVTAVFDGSWYRLYIDRELVGRLAVTAGSHTASTAAWNISHSSSEQFQGYMRDIRVWKAALTHEEIIELYVSATVPQTDSLGAEWLLTEGTGTTANDTSGNSNNGTITGTAWSSNSPT